MRNGGSPAHRFWTSSSTQLVSLWRHVSEHPPGRNIKVPLARNLPSPLGWNAFWRESLSSLQRKTAKKTPPIEGLPFEIETPGSFLLTRHISLLFRQFLSLIVQLCNLVAHHVGLGKRGYRVSSINGILLPLDGLDFPRTYKLPIHAG